MSAPAMTTAPSVDSDRIEIHGYRVEELAGLVRMCGESIHTELVSIGRRYPDALVQHSQSVTDYIDTLADIFCETAVQIRNDAETLAGCHVPAVTGAKRFPSQTQWREYQTAVTALNANPDDDNDLRLVAFEKMPRDFGHGLPAYKEARPERGQRTGPGTPPGRGAPSGCYAS